MLLLTVLMLKQFIMNLLDLINPGRKFGKKFKKFERLMNKFQQDHPEVYEKDEDNEADND